MIDLVKLLLTAGNGGLGRISFRREKYVPKGGPDGGHGGSGGNVILRAVDNLSTLRHLAGEKELRATSGQAGGKRRMIGSRGQDTVIELPVGTVVWLLAENNISRQRRESIGLMQLLGRGDVKIEKYALAHEGQPIPEREPDSIDKEELQALATTKNQDFKRLEKTKLLELTEVGQEVVLCQGGFGGRGNESFKGPEMTTPLVAEYGTFGEQKLVAFELRLLADVGLVGFPNAGKSTLLSTITKAKPKIAAYPFTTLEPNLGVFSYDEHELVIADIPGLVEGASEGKGLGYDFLRHIENCRAVLMLVGLDELEIYDEDVDDEGKAERVWQQFVTLSKEMAEYSPELVTKPLVVALSKVELYPSELKEQIIALFTKHGQTLSPFSSATQEGLASLKEQLVTLTSHTTS